MSEQNNTTNGGGIVFIGLLTILFIGLKLTGYINWSWIWVVSPMWISACLTLLIVGACYGIFWLYEMDTRKRDRRK
jgi:hypothetical protein